MGLTDVLKLAIILSNFNNIRKSANTCLPHCLKFSHLAAIFPGVAGLGTPGILLQAALRCWIDVKT